MVYVGVGVTSKDTMKFSEIPLPPDTVTVAVYVPTASPIFGVTVKLLLPPTAMSDIEVLFSEKLVAFVPDRAIVSAPVGWLPVLLTVTL